MTAATALQLSDRRLFYFSTETRISATAKLGYAAFADLKALAYVIREASGYVHLRVSGRMCREMAFSGGAAGVGREFLWISMLMRLFCWGGSVS